MLPLVAALALAQQDLVNISTTDLLNPAHGPSRSEIWFRPEVRLDPPKQSPKEFGVGDLRQRWEFDFGMLGYALLPDKNGVARLARFYVYEQERKDKNDIAFSVTRMLLRLWEHLYYDLRLDHSVKYDRKCVDVYLCWGGPPGGQQLSDIDRQNRPPLGEEIADKGEQAYAKDPQLKTSLPVNTIYIYDIPTFTDPVEMAREVAHEYGHATMPPVGGFKTPEEWGNGYFGEKLFLIYMRDQLLAGKLKPEDAMGATGPQLDAWVKHNVDPLVAAASVGPPDMASLGSIGQHGMNAYMGLLLYCYEILPQPVFTYLMSIMTPPVDRGGTYAPADIPPLIQLAIDHAREIPLRVPPGLAGKPIWVPVSGAKVVGASVLQKKDGWAQIKPTGGELKLVNPSPDDRPPPSR